MKFDRETILKMIVGAVIILGWTPICRWMGWMAPPPVETRQQTVPPSPPPAPQPVTPAAAPSPATPAVVPENLPALPPQTLSNASIKVEFSPAAGAIRSIELLDYLTADHEQHIVLDNNLNGRMSSPLHPGALSVFGATPWQLVEIIDNSKIDDSTYHLQRKLATADGSEFILTQEWTLSGDYAIVYRFSLTNLSDQPLVFSRLSVSGGDLQPWHILSGDRKSRSDTNTIDVLTVKDSTKSIAIDDDPEDFAVMPDAAVRWASMSNKYFTTILVGNTPYGLLKKRAEVTDAGRKYFLAMVGADYYDVKLEAGQQQSFDFKYYAGPKILSQLKSFDGSTTKLMHLSSWGPISFLAEWLLYFLIFLKGLCGSYGCSIIILTLLVRLLFWPITQKANASMKKMAAVQPKVKELREKYKNEPQILNAKMMALYKEEGINPLGGCLPILLQIPVFLALYSALNSAVQLRQVSFLWAKDLASPDTVAVLPLGFMNLSINPLVLMMTGLMIFQQRITPSAMDPTQQKMMMIMPLVMVFFFYDLPSGLTLYWTVSQIFSIIQLYWQRHSVNKAAAAKA